MKIKNLFTSFVLFTLLISTSVFAADGLTFGGIGVTGNSTAETTTDVTPRKIVAFDTEGQANRVTVSHANDNIVIVEAGTYIINGHISFSGTLSKTFVIQVYKDTTAIGIPMERKMGTGGDIGAASFCALNVLEIGDEISVYHHSTDGGITFTARHISLVLQRVL